MLEVRRQQQPLFEIFTLSKSASKPTSEPTKICHGIVFLICTAVSVQESWTKLGGLGENKLTRERRKVNQPEIYNLPLSIPGSPAWHRTGQHLLKKFTGDESELGRSGHWVQVQGILKLDNTRVVDRWLYFCNKSLV